MQLPVKYDYFKVRKNLKKKTKNPESLMRLFLDEGEIVEENKHISTTGKRQII